MKHLFESDTNALFQSLSYSSEAETTLGALAFAYAWRCDNSL